MRIISKKLQKSKSKYQSQSTVGGSKSNMYDGRRIFIHHQRGIPYKNTPEGDFFCQSTFLEEILEKEHVKAVCMSTYILSLETLQKEFPALMKKTSNIPFVMFHGDQVTSSIEHDKSFGDVQRVSSQDSDIICSTSVHFIEVVAQEPRRYTNEGLQRKVINGAHHAKYILVFTESGLYVLITSANMTTDDSVDLTWIQFFPRLKSQNSSGSIKGNFGSTLQNFLIHQSDQLVYRNIPTNTALVSIISWLREHVSFTGDLVDVYDFSKASADLITVVPGYQTDHDCRKNMGDEKMKVPIEFRRFIQIGSKIGGFGARKTHKGSYFISAPDEKEDLKKMVDEKRKFGLERVRECLSKSHSMELLPSDRFGIQVTSIRDKVSLDFFEYLIATFDPEGQFVDVEDLDDRVKLIWPTKEYVEAAGSGQGLFLKKDVFEKLDEVVKCYFHEYCPNKAERFVSKIAMPMTIPHSKVYFRFSDPPIKDQIHLCNCTDVRWFMLTSANLSRAAQGMSLLSSCYCRWRKMCSYRNFEMGILLKSTPSTKLKLMSGSCPIHSKKHIEKSNETVLPVPFELTGSSYCGIKDPYTT
jgi:hypothetical protein